MVYQSIQKFAFYLAGAKCTLYCDHKPLMPFFTIGTSCPVLNGWALECQQFDIKFEHIQGKKNMVTDTVSRVRTLGLYQDDDDDDDVPITTKNVIKNIREEVHSTGVVPRTPAYNTGKLNLRHAKEGTAAGLGLQSGKPKYTIEPTIVVPHKLTSLIIVEFHNVKGHQGISHTINMMRCYFW